MSIAPTNAALTIGQTQQFTATVPGGGAATWTVDTIAGGNASVGVVTATGLYTAGTAPGVHNLIATSVANTTQTATAIAAVTDLAGIYTWHNNNSRNGANTQEYALTPTNVNPTSFGKLASCTVGGPPPTTSYLSPPNMMDSLPSMRIRRRARCCGRRTSSTRRTAPPPARRPFRPMW
jgi:hypothetical protein